MAKKSKHYDNSRDLLMAMKRTKMQADNAVSATFSAYMMLGCLVLFEDLGFREKRLRTFISGFYKRMDDYHNGTLTMSDVSKKLMEEVNVYVEPPRV